MLRLNRLRMNEPDTLYREIIIKDPMGLHARPAGRLVRLVNLFSSDVFVSKNNTTVPASSIMSLMALSATKGTALTLSTKGVDAEKALNILSAFLEQEMLLSSDKSEVILNGLAISEGVVIGPVCVIEKGHVDIPEQKIKKEGIALQTERLKKAILETIEQLHALKKKPQKATAKENVTSLLDTYLNMLEDSKLVRGALRRIEKEKINAEFAIKLEVTALSDDFSKIENAYISSRIKDIEDVANRIIQNLLGKPSESFETLHPGTIIFADELSPADTALMDHHFIGGFATIYGGQETHPAIIARSLGIPAVSGTRKLLSTFRDAKVSDHSIVILDGNLGQIIFNPSPETFDIYCELISKTEIQKKALYSKIKNTPSTTADGTPVEILANLELTKELNAAASSDAAGIGLLRSEFMFMNRQTIPTEEEQYKTLVEILQKMGAKPVTFRLLDVGHDKLPECLKKKPYMQYDPNPVLGVRGIRLTLQNQDLLIPQLRAAIRASKHGALRIVAPMITTLKEVLTIKEIYHETFLKLQKEGADIPLEKPPLGIMIEVPSAALMSPSLAEEADFFCIGTNDLTMYTLASDRGNENVAYLYNDIHPSILKLINLAVDAAIHKGIPITLCGSMASNLQYLTLLLGLGLRSFSVPITKITETKDHVQKINLKKIVSRTKQVLKYKSTTEIKAFMEEANASVFLGD
ncbi:MAG: phosphoenolpyruvate--protein phosphotransferase [Alphaproteobacteria bacterium]